jgi:hypothetical protein
VRDETTLADSICIICINVIISQTFFAKRDVSKAVEEHEYVRITNFMDIIHRLSLIKKFNKNTTFRGLESVSLFRYKLLCWAQSTELVPIFGCFT